ncbi:hypothetical protein KHA80_11940 [Anaerobacillus sp. HL2]|nr:hypothetical protein KHA80_11940 [Anaerobacillus sp. HL2]
MKFFDMKDRLDSQVNADKDEVKSAFVNALISLQGEVIVRELIVNRFC